MVKYICVTFITAMLLVNTAHAQELRVSQMNFARAVENREPVGIDTVFASNTENVFCFTRIESTTDTTQIAHVWYYKDQEKARINLQVQSDDWRTWSSKTILPSWTGRWRVMVEGPNGTVLDNKTFVIR